MKKHILLGAVLLSLFAASCSNEDVINNDSETQEGQTISLQANITGGSGTRMAYEDDETNKELKFSWSDKESFQLYKGTGSTATTFSKTANGNIFTGTIPGGGTDTYYAVYGNNIKNTNGVLYVNIANQTGVASAENGITTFMLAQAKYLTQASGMTPTLDFQHKLGVMKLTITLPDGVTGKVGQVTVKGLHNKASYTLSTKAYSNEANGDITVTGFSYSSDKKITAYVGVFPEKVAANQVTISVKVDNYDYDYTIAEAKTLAACKVVPVLATIKTNFKSVYTSADYKTWSKENCGSAPRSDKIRMYLGAGVYWDKGAEGENQQTYTLPNGKSYNEGLWVMKKAYISGFNDYTANKVDRVSSTDNSDCWHIGRPAANEIYKYFFLPAAGSYINGYFYDAGFRGGYWSNSPTVDNVTYLHFSSSEAMVYIDKDYNRHLPMIAE